MKILYSGLLLGCILSLSLIGTSSAQVVIPEITITSTSNIPEKVSKAFKTAFKDATDVKWFSKDEKFVVSFLKDDQKNRALFTKRGYLVYHITYGQEKNMPGDVRSIVKSKYFDYNIISAINVKQEDRNIWLVSIEDEKGYKQLNVEDGTISVIENFKKNVQRNLAKGPDERINKGGY